MNIIRPQPHGTPNCETSEKGFLQVVVTSTWFTGSNCQTGPPSFHCRSPSRTCGSSLRPLVRSQNEESGLTDRNLNRNKLFREVVLLECEQWRKNTLGLVRVI